MYYFLLFLFGLLGIENYILGSRICLNVKMKRRWSVFVGMGLYIFPVIKWGNNLDVIYIWKTAIAIITVFFCMSQNIKKRLANTFVLIFILTCIEQILCVILEPVVEKIIWQNEDILENILLEAAICLVLFIFQMLKKGWKREGLKIGDTIVYLVVGAMGAMLLFTITGLEVADDQMNNARFSFMCNILIPAASASVGALGILILYINKLNDRLKEYLKKEKELHQTQENYYRILQEKEADTKKFRHDMNNHIMCLYDLLKEDNSEQALDYLESMQYQMKEIQNKCYITGNQILDAILNYHLLPLNALVDVKVQGKCTGELQISNMEFCIIIANLVQNATEAVKRDGLENAFIDVELHTGKENFCFEISNLTADLRPVSGNRFLSSLKEDNENHGIGLKNVEETVRKNQGIIEMENKDGVFKVKVILPLEDKSSRLRG